ncbi:MAG: peptide-binding protein [Deltaproteobacteria bacterium]|nr:peptide-binding protein [Deltaproteobacteria bacterium]
MIIAGGAPPRAEEAAGRLHEIRIADGKGDWGFPNPFRHYPRGPGYVRMSWVFDTLVWKNEAGFIPALATAWRYEPGKNSFVFHLREDARWHDGRPFRAEDVVFTLRYFKKHPYAWVPMESVAGAEKSGPFQVTVRLARPDASFMAYVGGTMPILPEHIWKGVKDPRTFNAPEAYIGTGPYRFVEFTKAKGTYLYESFDAYYLGRPRAGRLIYIKAGNPLMALLSGKADLANIKPDMAETLAEKGMEILENPRGWNKKLMINHRKPPFSDKRFRRALAHAIDRQAVVDKAHRGFGSPASFGLLSPDHPMYNPDTPSYAPDPARARAILASMGYEPGDDGVLQKDGSPLRVELLASNITVAGESVSDRDGEVIKRQLEAAGIQVDLVHLEQATADARILGWEFDLAVSGHGGLLGDARVLNRMIHPDITGSVNSARYGVSAEPLEPMEAQVREMDPERRTALVHRTQRLYAEELPAISLYYPASMAACNPEKGVRWFYTHGGIALGIPIPQNKLSLICGATGGDSCGSPGAAD